MTIGRTTKSIMAIRRMTLSRMTLRRVRLRNTTIRIMTIRRMALSRIRPGINVIKLFSFVADDAAKEARVSSRPDWKGFPRAAY